MSLRTNITCLVLSALLVPFANTSRAQPAIEGVWSTALTAPDLEAWEIEDYYCFDGCPVAVRAYMRALVQDPANDERPYIDLEVETTDFAREHLAGLLTDNGRENLRTFQEDVAADSILQCAPFGYFRQTLSPLPLKISQLEDEVVFEYEAWGGVRRASLGEMPAEPPPEFRLGHSFGRYEGNVLVVETVGIEAGDYWPQITGGRYSNELRAVERYRVSEDGAVLHLELTLHDPVMLREPWVWTKIWQSTPDIELLPHGCNTISGERAQSPNTSDG